MKTNWFMILITIAFAISTQIVAQDDSDLFVEEDVEIGLEEISEGDVETTFEEMTKEEYPEVSDAKDIKNFADTLEDKNTSALDKLPKINEEQSKEISDLFEKAAKNYQDILDNRPEAEARSNAERLDANKGLLKSNRGKLAVSQSDLRRTKLEYIKRFLILKNSYKQGNFTKEKYDQELAKLAGSYDFKVKGLVEDKDFYKGEFQQTHERVKALEELDRIHNIMHPKKKKEDVKKNKRPLTELEKMMKKVQSTSDLFEVKDVWDAPDRN